MYDHIGLKVKDIDLSLRFYTAALAGLGHVLCSQDDDGASFGHDKDSPSLYLYRAKDAPSAAVHVALRAASRSAVDRFFAGGLEAGGRDNGRPGVREDYAATYYAAFLFDPDGNNIEAVCLR